MPSTRPENCCSRTSSVMRRLSMNLMPFSRAANSRQRVSAAPFQHHARAGDLARIAHDARREMAGALALDARVLLRDGSCLHVGLVADLEDGECPPGARNAAGRVRAGDARKAHIVVHQELPGAVAIFGPGPLHIAVVVAVRRLRRDVEHRPVGHVPEQEVDVFPHFLGLVQRSNRDEAFLVGFAGDVAQLAGVAAAQRDLAAAVGHFAADVEVLVDDEHPQAGVARPDGAWEAGRTRSR